MNNETLIFLVSRFLFEKKKIQLKKIPIKEIVNGTSHQKKLLIAVKNLIKRL